MRQRKQKRSGVNTIPHTKVDVFLQVPEVLHSWLRDEAKAGGLKNVQEKILDLIRQARDVATAKAA